MVKVERFNCSQVVSFTVFFRGAVSIEFVRTPVPFTRIVVLL